MAYSINAKDHFNTKLYTGNGSAGHSITGVGFQPDWVWMKPRAFSENHALYDSVRGTTKRLMSNSSEVEETRTNGLSAFGADGFTVNADNGENKSSETMVAWNWKLGTTSGITTNGSTTITPTAYSFNASSGISAIKCTGTGAAGLFPHGLGVAPQVVISKRLNTANSWFVQTDQYTSWTSGNYLKLDADTAIGTNTGIVNATDATNVSLAGADDWVNASGDTYIHYCFASTIGFSRMGLYFGNGSTDGGFINCGFKPAFIMVKCTSHTGNWFMFDTKRIGYNSGGNYRLYADGAGAESDGGDMDILSNGFKWRMTSNNTNGSGRSYFYMAFAEAPLVGSNNIPATAR